ncbi:putative inosine-uridine preferring nucleoside hydrolase [Phaeomoniella chlamydospora]|uniref:Putative inosine-uridine preferring nucleoside hydrolase n=1 Tax=Phaeomoniella chlamydospora TaxID=158046 RepID=A0A0G2ES88_PHACM|nr:putative inosine-uridine preferring nucleoside hydrolase [Phaeomoniella chlamydospora]
MRVHKPLVAIGAEEPLEDQLIMADYFHGRDGLAGIHTTHPHWSPAQTWDHLFEEPPPDDGIVSAAKDTADLEKPPSFVPSYKPAHKEILRILKENEPDTITIVSVGPLTNLALAAAEDPVTFLRAQEVVSMGGAVDVDGNVTPVAEFNVFADAIAAARVYALTSPRPASTMPVSFKKSVLPPYPPSLPKQLKLTLFALDLTEHHALSRGLFNEKAKDLVAAGSPLAEWMSTFMKPMFEKMERLSVGHEGDAASLGLHDPLCIWYVLTKHSPAWVRSPQSPEDIRVETAGQWSRGKTMRDTRTRKRRDSDGEVPHDVGNWLGRVSGNRIDRMIGSPGEDAFPRYLMERILG